MRALSLSLVAFSLTLPHAADGVRMVKRREDEAVEVKQDSSGFYADSPFGLRDSDDYLKSVFTLLNMKSQGVLTHANHGQGKGPIEIWRELNNGTNTQVQWRFERVNYAWPPDQYVLINRKSNAALLHANHGRGKGPIEDWWEFNVASYTSGGSWNQAVWKVEPRPGQPGVWTFENMKSRAMLTHANHGQGRGPIEVWNDLSPDNVQTHWKLTQQFGPRELAPRTGTCAVNLRATRTVKCRRHANENTTEEVVPEAVPGCADNMDENTTHVFMGMHLTWNGSAQYRFSEAWSQSYVSNTAHQWTGFTPLHADGDAHCPDNHVATGIQQRENYRGNVQERFYRLRCSRVETLRQSQEHYSPWYAVSMDYVVPPYNSVAEGFAEDLVIGMETRWKRGQYRAIRFKTARFSGHCAPQQ